MREILFRGKRTDNGEWIEGFYIGLFDIQGNKRFRVYTGFAERNADGWYPDWYDVCPETIGQYTGLTDKNSNKIFEGDIVFYEHEDVNGVINWDKQSARFIIDFDTWCTDFDSVYEGEIEVVGNIHDNPELLEREV